MAIPIFTRFGDNSNKFRGISERLLPLPVRRMDAWMGEWMTVTSGCFAYRPESHGSKCNVGVLWRPHDPSRAACVDADISCNGSRTEVLVAASLQLQSRNLFFFSLYYNFDILVFSFSYKFGQFLHQQDNNVFSPNGKHEKSAPDYNSSSKNTSRINYENNHNSNHHTTQPPTATTTTTVVVTTPA